MRTRSAILLSAFLCLLLGVLFAVPLWLVLRGGFWVDGRLTLRPVLAVFLNAVYLQGLRNSLFIALGTTFCSACIAVPLAWIGDQFDFAGKRLLSALVLLPMVLPPFVGAIGFQQIFGAYGVLNALLGLGPVDWLGGGQFFGVVLLQSLALYPILYLNASAALANIDPACEEAAANLGAGRATRFFRIVLPLAAPGLFAGGTLIFIWSFTELGTPLIMNFTRCASVQIYDALRDVGKSPFPYALTSVVLFSSVSLYALSRLLFARGHLAVAPKASVAKAPRPLRGLAAAAAALPYALVVFCALLPHLGVIFTSFSVPGSWYGTVLPAAWTGSNWLEALAHPLTISSIRNSVLFAACAVVADTALGLGIAFVVVRSRLRFRGFLDALSMLPLAVPGLVMAFGFIAVSSWLANQKAFAGEPWWAQLVDVRTNPTLFLVIAYAVRRMPYMVRSAVAGLEQTSETYEEAAHNLGAGAATTLRRVTFPLITANLIAGGLLTFAFSMLEVSDSLMLAQQADYMPITKAVYELFQLLGSGPYVASALGVWAMAFLATTLVGASLLLGKKMGALFRL